MGRIRVLRSALLGVLVTLVVPMAHPARAQDQRCFPQTGACVSGRFREYWEQNGRLAVFGFPITGSRNEANRDTAQTYVTQWFERTRFELHPENRSPYDVLLGRLGEDRLGRIGVDWQRGPGSDEPFPDTCLQFTQTECLVCDQALRLGRRCVALGTLRV